MKNTHIAIISITIGLSAGVLAKPGRPVPSPPDLTQSDEIAEINRRYTYNLGPTGMRGWIYTRPASNFDAVQGRTSSFSRQILVTHVGKGSPAEGVMKIDDVIIGIGDKLFIDDARQVFAMAIEDAEKTENNGILDLMVWRDGKVDRQKLKLRVLGDYTDTSPYDDTKSKRILDEACAVLANDPVPKRIIWKAISGLALMASGKSEYLPRVREWAHEMGPLMVKDGSRPGTWDCAYMTIFLCEYYLLTGDKDVLHAIGVYTRHIADGGSIYGTYGHGYARQPVNGGFPGAVPPYGPVNQAGLAANIAMVLGRKCGVNAPEVDAAIERGSKFFGYYVDKGGIPYGEHEPYMYHGANGKNALTAMFFGLQSDRTREAKFFAKMAVAAFKNQEHGHTGQGFSYLWGNLGANIGGPDALAAYFNRTSWHRDLERRSDGAFAYTGREQYGPNFTKDGTYFGESSYSGMNSTACYVITYSLPLRNLHITGKDANPAYRLSEAEVAAAVASGNFDLDRKRMSAEELVAAFGDWSPVVRDWAASELALRPEAEAMVPRLIEMAKEAKGVDAHQSQGAVQTLGLMKITEALPVLIPLLTHEDHWLRYRAAEAIERVGIDAESDGIALLKAMLANSHPITPVSWDDPIQFAHTKLTQATFTKSMQESFADADRSLLYPAVETILTTPDAGARRNLNRLENILSAEDVQKLGPGIMAAIEDQPPANTMGTSISRGAALRLLVKFRFKEAMPLCITTMDINAWGKKSRIQNGLKMLESYGGAAKEVLPLLDKLEQDLLDHREAGGLAKHIEQLREVREVIKNDNDPKPVRSLK